MPRNECEACTATMVGTRGSSRYDCVDPDRYAKIKHQLYEVADQLYNRPGQAQPASRVSHNLLISIPLLLFSRAVATPDGGLLGGSSNALAPAEESVALFDDPVKSSLPRVSRRYEHIQP